jgi:transcriptional regulator with XRE-family HTH domain
MCCTTHHTEGHTMGTTDTPTSPPAEGTAFLTWLEDMRAERDMSWAEVSRRSGISDNGLRKIRQGEATPRPATVEALAAAFDVAPDDAPLPDFVFDGAVGEVKMPPPIPARRGDGGATTYVTVGIRGARGERLDRETAGRLIAFLEAAGRAWVLTADCTERD